MDVELALGGASLLSVCVCLSSITDEKKRPTRKSVGNRTGLQDRLYIPILLNRSDVCRSCSALSPAMS